MAAPEPTRRPATAAAGRWPSRAAAGRSRTEARPTISTASKRWGAHQWYDPRARRSSGAGGYQSVQAGVNAASSGDVVEIAAGSYTENVTVAGKAVTLAGAGSSGASVTSLHGQITASGLLNGALLLTDIAVDAAGHQYGVFVSSSSTAAAGSVTLDDVAISGGPAERVCLYPGRAMARHRRWPTPSARFRSCTRSSPGTRPRQRARAAVATFCCSASTAISRSTTSIFMIQALARRRRCRCGAIRTARMSAASGLTTRPATCLSPT